MKLHQVHYFLALCREKNFTRAARRCGVRQPSITVAIKRLEREFGGLLFERSNASIRLTALGNLVRPDLARIDRSATEAKRKAEKFRMAASAPPPSAAVEAVSDAGDPA